MVIEERQQLREAIKRLKQSLPSKATLTLLSMAVLCCSPVPPATDTPEDHTHGNARPIPEKAQKFAADTPLSPAGQPVPPTQRDSNQGSPPTDSSPAREKRVPQTLNRLASASNSWASLEDYQRWLVEFLENGEHPLEFFGSVVKRMEPALFGIQPSDTVADIGCGTGSLEMSFLTRNVPFKKLYAVDIDKESLDFLAFALDSSKLDPDKRVEVVHSSLEDVRLPENSIDVMLVLYTRLMLPDASDPSTQRSAATKALFTTIKKALKPGATVHWIRQNEPKPEWVIARMTEMGFELILHEELEHKAIGIQKADSHYHLAFRHPS